MLESGGLAKGRFDNYNKGYLKKHYCFLKKWKGPGPPGLPFVRDPALILHNII